MRGLANRAALAGYFDIVNSELLISLVSVYLSLRVRFLPY